MTSPIEQIQLAFELSNLSELNLTPRYNVAPSQQVFSIISDGENKRGGFLKWGLVPSWSKDSKIGYKMINARSETVDTKPSFKNLLKRRRCLIVADGFYEWKNEDGKKQPFRIKMKDDRVFAFAGLWDRWQSNGETIQSCTIITTEANDVVSDIHDRMPVILPKEKQEIWLNPAVQEPKHLKQLLQPYTSDEMTAYQVSTLVNSPKNDVSEIINSL
ncbi:SOS response-associated peptidase [Sporosarcina ureilytica]